MTTTPDHSSATDDPNLKRTLGFEDAARIVRSAVPVAITCLGVLALLGTMYFAADFFVPVLISIFLAITLRPVVRAMKRVRIPEGVGALIVVLGVVALLAGAVYQISGPAKGWIDRIPSIQAEVEAKLWPVRRSLEQAQEATEQLRKLTDGRNAATTREVTVKEVPLLTQAFRSTWFTAVQMLITIVLTFFLLAQSEEDTRRNIRRLPFGRRRESMERALDAVQATVTRFLQISAIIYGCLGAATALVMHFLGMPNPILWGVLAMVLGFMPYLGPLIAFACIGVAALVSFDVWWQILAPPLAYGAMTMIEGNFITPAVLGRQLTLSPVAIFLSMLLWTWVLGILGALLAVPILVSLTIIFRQIAAIMREREGPAGRIAAAPPL